MNPDLIYATRKLQHADLLAEAEAEHCARQAATARIAKRMSLWRRLAAWLRRPARRAATNTR
jgi:hypothetical protein